MKKCILYDDRICNDCGECMRCDLDPDKICDNCGKCLKNTEDDEFRSVVIKRDEMEAEMKSDDQAEVDEAELSEEDRLLNAFLDAPIDLRVPEPLQVDPELAAKWDRILSEYEEKERNEEALDEPEPEIALRGVRKRRRIRE